MSRGTFKPLSCAGCGAPLTVAPGQQVVTCSYCRQSHSFVPPPPPEPRGARYREGDEVAVLWGECWWPGRVVAVESAKRWRIHFDGWGDHWDETVGADRIRHQTPADQGNTRRPRTRLVAALVVAGLALAVGIGSYVASTAPGRAGPGSATKSKGPGDPKGRYAEDDRVDVYWGSRWWPGRIEEVKGKKRYLISYDGWAARWNEVVGPKRLRPRGE